MNSSTKEWHAKIPFSYKERALITSSSTGVLESSSSTKTVRLESLAQWKGNEWIHPFGDIDLGLLSDSKIYNNMISRVQMSISSHGAQRFPARSKGLDDVPVLPLWRDGQNDEGSPLSNVHDNERYLSVPQGFFLSIQTVHGLTAEEEAKAIQAVFQELLRTRLLTTPVTGGEWDVVEDNEDLMSVQNSSPRLYQLIMPFDSAAWSSDALAQSFRNTLPKVCRSPGDANSKYGNDRFFGWSAWEWSNFLVGYQDGGGKLGRGDKQSLQHLTDNKLMWWTWTSSSYPSRNEGNSNEQSLSFGIQYQTTIPSNAKNWLPENFIDETSSCPVGERSAFEMLHMRKAGLAKSYQLVPITARNMEVPSEEIESYLAPKFSYSVGIEQVLRRHHTNQGRFESSIDLHPLFDLDSGNLLTCRMKYRQLLPGFFTPMWRSLQIVDDNIDGAGTVCDAFYSNSDQLQASVEWNQDDQSSILTVEAISGRESTSSSSSSSLLPSTVFISLEYGPSFLTIDDFPGDPNRGRVLPPARVTVRCDPSKGPETDSTTTVVYSNSLLLLPPVPDLSMPFNVISLTSSLYAYIVGTIVAILVRKGSERIKYKMYPDKKPKSKFTILKEKVRQKIDQVKTKLSGKQERNAMEKKRFKRHQPIPEQNLAVSEME